MLSVSLLVCFISSAGWLGLGWFGLLTQWKKYFSGNSRRYRYEASEEWNWEEEEERKVSRSKNDNMCDQLLVVRLGHLSSSCKCNPSWRTRRGSWSPRWAASQSHTHPADRHMHSLHLPAPALIQPRWSMRLSLYSLLRPWRRLGDPGHSRYPKLDTFFREEYWLSTETETTFLNLTGNQPNWQSKVFIKMII